MAKYSSLNLSITLNGVNITQHVLRIGNVKVSVLLQESHTFGDTWFEALSTGIKKMDDLVIGGFYDDTVTTGPNDIVNTNFGTAVSIVITWGGTKTTSFSAIIMDYERIPTRNQFHEYNVTLRPTGAVTEA